MIGKGALKRLADPSPDPVPHIRFPQLFACDNSHLQFVRREGEQDAGAAVNLFSLLKDRLKIGVLL